MIPSIRLSGRPKTMETVKSQQLPGVGGRERRVGRAQRSFTQWNHSAWCYNSGHISLYSCQNPQNVHHRENLNANCGLWVMMVCECRSTDYNRCSMLVWDGDDSGGGCACVGPGGMWELSILSTQFCCEPKTALRNTEKRINKRKKKKEGKRDLCHACVWSVMSLCDSLECSPPGSSVHEISQARILARVAISYSRESFRPRDRTHISCICCIGRWILYQLGSPFLRRKFWS